MAFHGFLGPGLHLCHGGRRGDGCATAAGDGAHRSRLPNGRVRASEGFSMLHLSLSGLEICHKSMEMPSKWPKIDIKSMVKTPQAALRPCAASGRIVHPSLSRAKKTPCSGSSGLEAAGSKGVKCPVSLNLNISFILYTNVMYTYIFFYISISLLLIR